MRCGGRPLRYRQFVSAYQRAVRSVSSERLAALGFSLHKDKWFRDALVAESELCRVLFDPNQFILYVQQVPSSPSEAGPAYDLNLLLKATGSEAEFEPQPTEVDDPVMVEVDRMIRLLVEQCRPILDGDDAAWQRAHELSADKEKETFTKLDAVGLRLKDGECWRELPELDSVRVKAGNKPLNVFLALLLLLIPGGYTIFLAVVYCTFLIGPPQKDTLPMLLLFSAFGIPMILLDVWIAKRVLLCQYSWETNRDGLAIGTLLKKVFVRWTDVESAAALPSGLFEIRTPGRTIKLEKGALENVCLEASIWQHLNRVGKADAMQLSPFAMSLWAQIPEETHEEIHWESPNPPHALDIILRFVAWEVLIWGLALRFKLAPRVVAISTVPVWSMVSNLVLIKRVSVLSDRIEACTALGKLSIPWSAVRSLNFLAGQPSYMLIRGRACSYIKIPWFADHPNCTRIMLTIIRRLRQEERFKLLPFPSVLLMAAYGGDQDLER